MVVEPNCKESEVTEFVRGRVDGAEFTRVHGKELSYTLPLDKVSQFSGGNIERCNILIMVNKNYTFKNSRTFKHLLLIPNETHVMFHENKILHC
jgi:hypothetical protein